MTNEEAIDAIKSNIPSSGHTTLCEALGKAIEALENDIRESEAEGYKAFAFHGTMKITPKCNVKPFTITCDWLYNPEYNCWYGNGRSFTADICEIVEEV